MDTPWKLDPQRAALQAGGLSGQVSLAHPALGLHNLQPGGGPIREGHLLGVQWGDDGPRAPTDVYFRGGDLIVTYAEDGRRPYAPQVYWRWLGPAAGRHGDSASLELLVSVQTELLDVQPAMTVTTRLPAIEAWHLTDPDSGGWSNVALDRTVTTITPRDGSSCLLLRLAGGERSYVEMVYPPDFVAGQIAVSATAGTVVLKRALIDCRLEKGVIIRARVRGCIVPTKDDAATAWQLFQEFAGSALPLSA